VLDEIKVFVRAVELKSISAAARSLRLSAAVGSHRIIQLEEKLGVRLLNRTTRSLQTTEAGRIFYGHAVEILDTVERAENSLVRASGVVSGSLRVTAPLGFGRKILAPLISKLHTRYPEMEIRLRLSDHMLDLLSESVDVAIRMAVLSDSSFVVRKLADCPRVLCASPTYLKRCGTPQNPEDLLNHNCLLLRFPGSTQFRWTLTTPTDPMTLKVAGKFDADDGDVLTEWALAGDGIALKPRWEIAEYLEDGRLDVVLADFPPEPVSLVLMYPHRRLLPANVRTFADFMAHNVKPLIDHKKRSP
jgi:DNA-binding transcriptional LysR family regulator